MRQPHTPAFISKPSLDIAFSNCRASFHTVDDQKKQFPRFETCVKSLPEMVQPRLLLPDASAILVAVCIDPCYQNSQERRALRLGKTNRTGLLGGCFRMLGIALTMVRTHFMQS